MHRRVGALAVAVLALTSLLAGSPASATNPKDDARHRALVLADQVAGLEARVEVAGENFAAEQAALGDLVSQQAAAQQRLDSLRSSTSNDALALHQQVRALYMTAGSVTLLPSLLRGSSPQDVLNQLDTVDRVLNHQQRAAGSVQARLGSVQATNTRLEKLADQRTTLAVQADSAQAALQTLLDERQTALDSASADVRGLEQEAIAQKEAEAAARAAVTLASQHVAVSPDVPNPLPVASPVAAVAIAAARAQIGKPYVSAGNGPDSFDCSGLTRWAYAAAGIALPRVSRQQWNIGPHIALSQLRPGDLLFWATDVTNPGTIHHVALYVGAGWMIEAPHTGAFVRFSQVYLDGYIGASRPPGV